jgi:hypothetical protein
MVAMTFNWTALWVSAGGAVLGGLVGAVYAGARNRAYEGPVLVGAATGAIVASVATPKALPAA